MNMNLLERIDTGKDRLLWGALAGGTAVLAAALARQALHAGWRRASGEDPPVNPASPETNWRDAFVWSVGTGVLVGLARLSARRLAASGWHRTTGELPPM